MANEIVTTRKGPVLEITLNRPEIGNAASDGMAVELTKLLLGAGESSEIVVLRGAGDDFCVGRETMGKRPRGQQPDALDVRRRTDVERDQECEVETLARLSLDEVGPAEQRRDEHRMAEARDGEQFGDTLEGADDDRPEVRKLVQGGRVFLMWVRKR
jgi:hypothetical protein